MIERRDVSIERRKSEIAKQIRKLAIDNMFHRAICLCDIPNTEEKIKNLLDEFNYLCELQEGAK